MVKKLKSANYYSFAVIGFDSTYLYGFADTRGRNELYRIVKGETNPATSGNGGNAVLVATFVAQDDLIISVKALDDNNMNVVVWSDSKEGTGTGDGDIWHIDIGGSMPAAPTIAAVFPDAGLKSLGQDGIEYGSIGSLGNRSLMVTYQNNETAADQLLYMSDTSSGEDMSIIATFPHTTVTRHLHSVNIAPDGNVWISSGDNDDQSAIIIWNPSIAPTWPTITSWVQLDGVAGFQVFSQSTEVSISDKRFRTTNFTFKDGFVYYMVDEYLIAQNTARGIWRMPYGSPALPERVSDHIITVGGAGARWGWMGQLIGNKLIFTDAMQSLEALTGNFNNFIYSSDAGEGGSWEVTGSVMGTVGSAADPATNFSMPLRAILAIDGELHYSASSMAGKETTYNTEVFSVSNEDLIINEASPFPYLRLSPSYYIDPAGSDGNSGWSPAFAKATPTAMMESSNITFGSSVNFLGDIAATTNVDPRWNTMADTRAAVNDNGPAIMLSKPDDTGYQWRQASGPVNLIVTDTADHSIISDGVDIISDVSTGQAYTTLFSLNEPIYLELRNAETNSLDTRTISLGQGQSFYAFQSTLGAALGNVNNSLAFRDASSGGNTIVIEGCKVIGGETGINIRGAGTTLRLANTSLSEYGTDGGLITNGSASVIPELFNNTFHDDTNPAIIDSNGLGGGTWTGAEKNWFEKQPKPAFIPVAGEFQTDTPGFVNPDEGDYHLTEASELRNAGFDYDSEAHYDFDSVLFSTPLTIGAFEFIAVEGSPTLTTYDNQEFTLNDTINLGVSSNWTGVVADSFTSPDMPIGLSLSSTGTITGPIRVGGIIGCNIHVVGLNGQKLSAGFTWYERL